MPIGISYTSANGKSYGFNSSGANESLAKLKEIEAQTAADTKARLAKRRATAAGFGGIDNDDYHAQKEAREAERLRKKEAHSLGLKGNSFRDFMGGAKDALRNIKDIAKKLIGFGSSIEEKSGHLQLKGDDKFIGPGYAFGKSGKGFKGFWSVAELLEATDKREEGKSIGSGLSTDAEAEADMRKDEDSMPFKTPYLTRVFLAKEKTASGDEYQMMYAGLRTKKYTGRGRLFGVSDETLLPVAKIEASAERVPQIFDPVFDSTGILTGVERPLFPFGRQYIYGATMGTSSSIKKGLIYLEVTHAQGTTPATAVVMGRLNGVNIGLANSDDTKTNIPLYEIDDGNIVCDARCLLGLAMRE